MAGEPVDPELGLSELLSGHRQERFDAELQRFSRVRRLEREITASFEEPLSELEVYPSLEARSEIADTFDLFDPYAQLRQPPGVVTHQLDPMYRAVDRWVLGPELLTGGVDTQSGASSCPHPTFPSSTVSAKDGRFRLRICDDVPGSTASNGVTAHLSMEVHNPTGSSIRSTAEFDAAAVFVKQWDLNGPRSAAHTAVQLSANVYEFHNRTGLPVASVDLVRRDLRVTTATHPSSGTQTFVFAPLRARVPYTLKPSMWVEYDGITFPEPSYDVEFDVRFFDYVEDGRATTAIDCQLTNWSS